MTQSPEHLITRERAPAATPAAHPWVRRTSLIERLSAAGHEPVRLVIAPAGFGKTRLLADWAEGGAEDPIWVALPARLDDDAARHRVRTALGDARTAATRDGAMPRPATVIVDDAHRLPAEGAAALFAAADDGEVRVVLASRELAPAIGQRPLEPIVLPHDLAFGDAETAELARAFGLELDELALTALRKRTAGWPLATRMVLRRVASLRGDHRRGVEPAIDETCRLLLGDLRELPGAELLWTAAIPERFEPSQLPHVGLDDASPELLDEVAHRGLGWWTLTDGDACFEFQPMLRAHLRRLAGDERARRVHRGLASWHAERGETGAAFAAAVRGEEWDRAAELAAADLGEVIRTTNAQPALLAALPPHVVRSEPLLALLRGLDLYARGHSPTAAAVFSDMVTRIERQRQARRGGTTADDIWSQALVTVGLRLTGRYERVGPALQRFTDMLENAVEAGQALETAEDLLLVETAVTQLYLDQLDDALDSLHRRPRRGDPLTRQHLYGDALRLHILATQGRIAEAREARAHFLDQEHPPHFASSFWALPFHTATAVLHLENGDAAAAADALRPTEPHWATTEHWPLLLLAHVEIAWHRVDAATALETLRFRRDEQRHRAPISPALTARLHAREALLLTALGRYGEARRLLPARSASPHLAAARALLQLREGDAAKASESATRAFDRGGLAPRQQLEMHVIGAAAAHRLGNERQAARHRDHAEQLALRTGLRAPFAAIPIGERLALFGPHATVALGLRRVASLYANGAEMPRLTKRELVMLAELGNGFSVGETAAHHSVSVNTVKTQRKSLYRKLGVSSAEEAIAKAEDLGLL